MGTLASGSIDLKSLKVAGEPNKYITMISGSGIRVHEAGAVNTNFTQINSNGMKVYKGGTADSNIVASFGDTAQVGKSGTGHTYISSAGMKVYGSDGAVELANIGYGNGNASSGTAYAPYYTLGSENEDNIEAELKRGNWSFVEGCGTWAGGYASHVEGIGSSAMGQVSHAEGFNTSAFGQNSHAQNESTVAGSDNQTVLGRYNIRDNNGQYAVIIGNGSSSAPSNALTVDWDGNIKVANHLTAIGYTNNDSGSTKINSATSPYTPAKLSSAITLSTGTYVLMGEVSFPGNATGIRHIEWKEGASENSASTILSSRVTTSAAPAGAATKLQSTVIVNVTGSSQNYYLYCYHTSGVSQMEISYYWNFVRIV